MQTALSRVYNGVHLVMTVVSADVAEMKEADSDTCWLLMVDISRMTASDMLVGNA